MYRRLECVVVALCLSVLWSRCGRPAGVARYRVLFPWQPVGLLIRARCGCSVGEARGRRLGSASLERLIDSRSMLRYLSTAARARSAGAPCGARPTKCEIDRAS